MKRVKKLKTFAEYLFHAHKFEFSEKSTKVLWDVISEVLGNWKHDPNRGDLLTNSIASKYVSTKSI